MEELCDKLSLTGMIGLAADAMLRMAEKRIATPVCVLVRNDTVIDAFCADCYASSSRIVCHCEEAKPTWQSPVSNCAAQPEEEIPTAPAGPRNDMVAGSRAHYH